MKEPIQHDQLTGLPDRGYLWSLLDDTIKQIKRNRTTSGVLLIDLDNLDAVGKLTGNDGSDQFLKLMADRVKNCLWELDAAVRFNDSQIVIVANSITKPADVHVVMNKTYEYLSLECEINGEKILPLISIGIVLLPIDTTEVDEVMSQAAMALQYAKSHDEKSYYYYNQEFGAIIEEQEVVKNSILDTLEQESFVLMLQPKIDIKSNQVCGVEALVRMRDSEGNVVAPDEFIPIAENSNLILKIGDWVLNKTQQISRAWAKEGINIPISVNISDIQFRNGATLLSTLHQLVQENDGTASDLILEIGENIITSDVLIATTLLSEIKSYGYQVSLDGFGIGFSSLSVLKELKIDELKIDRHFLSGVPEDEKNTDILKSIITLAKSMDFRVVVMGVEQEEQLEVLKAHGCDEFQGFLISEPIDADDFADWYKKYTP